MTEETVIVVALFEAERELLRFFLSNWRELIDTSGETKETISALEETIQGLQHKLGVEE